MMENNNLEHRFVQHIPDQIEPGVLYVSMEFATAAHSCCCGCGEEVVTPITPTDWNLAFDGESVSLNPSIGNWTLACRSHYVIKRGLIIEAGPWTDQQIENERHRDRVAKARYYEASEHTKAVVPASQAVQVPLKPSYFRRFFRWVTGTRP